MLTALTSRINTKQLKGFLIFFWSLTILASVVWLFVQITQQGLLVFAQSSIFGLYIFLLFFMTLLKLLTLAKFQTNKVGLTILFLVEILSLNFTTVIPLFLLRNRIVSEENEWSFQRMFTVGLLGVALVLQTLIYLQFLKLS